MRILQGDVREKLRELDDESVHCVVTSPPYWGLRDYGVDGQIGLERCLGDHIETMVDVFREVRRVLRKDGTLWLNYGDAYACAPNGRAVADIKALGTDDRTFRDKPMSTVGAILKDWEKSSRPTDANYGSGAAMHGMRAAAVVGGYLKPKDRMLLPARVAIALQEDGWWVRDEIIWHKPNPMPISVRDRTTPAHEMVYMMSKSARYYYDQDAIRTPAKAPTTKMPDGWDTGSGAHGSVHRAGRQKGERVDKQRGHSRRHAGFNDGWDAMPKKQQSRSANKRSVWTVAPAPFREAHFATFPPDLVKPCILAGCPEGGTVLDPFFGAGTTGLVAKELGRNWIGIELNPAYIEIARRRIGFPEWLE